MDLSQVLPIPDLEACESILFIQPHPDDNEVGAGATIAKLAARGCKVSYLTVTDGSKGGDDPHAAPSVLRDLRYEEAKASAALLGVTQHHFLDLVDGGLPCEDELALHLVKVIRKVRPQLICTVDPYLPYEAHPDHRKVGLAAAQAALFSKNACYGSTEDAPWAVDGIAFHTTAWPNTFVDVDKTWDVKMAALAAHKSQFAPEYLALIGQYFEFKARQYAQGKGFERAEAFKVLTPTHLHMFVDAVHF